MGLVSRIDHQLQAWSRPLLTVLAAVLILLLGLLEYHTGTEFSLSIFYLLPLLLLAWYAGAAETYGCALWAALVWMVAETAGRHYQQPLAPYWNALVRSGVFLLVGHLVLWVKGLLARQRALAETDSLTGLLNPRCFYQRLENEAQRAGRYRHPFTLAYLDLDDFKQINDRLGHVAGDRLLQTVAEQLRQQVRSVDVAARLGGDEFALLLPETGFREADEALRKVRRALQTAMHDHQWPVTFSIGVATFCDAGKDLDTLLRAVDDLMYQAKRAGKDRLVHRQLGGG